MMFRWRSESGQSGDGHDLEMVVPADFGARIAGANSVWDVAVMFIRKKTVKGVTYYAVVENQRPRSEEKRWRTARDGRVVQRLIVSLGRHATVEAALADARWWLALHRKHVELGRKEHRNGLFLFQDIENGRIYTLPIGETAQERVEKLEKQVAKLEAALAVVSKAGA
jgi:hypothetical protein